MKHHRCTAWLPPALVVTGCATAPPPVMQVLEVQVEAENPAWGGPLPCEAANAAGRWPFTAPGSVMVQAAPDALHIRCQVPAGTVAAPSDTAPRAAAEVRQSAGTGAKMGAGAGVALGVAAVPVMGPAVAVLLAVGSAFKGAQIGGLVGAIRASGAPAYPSPIVVRIQRVPPAPGQASP
ncbi:MAG: hypothetical protein Q8K45_17280 [Rubrivivax sp.]|nr:hypothetical protein [Rubrivivax sp.]